MPAIQTYVVIPFKDEVEMTKHVVGLCVQESAAGSVLLYDNGSSDGTKEDLNDWLDSLDFRDTKVHHFEASGMGIYEMWNAGWQHALDNEPAGPVNVAFLNNDIHFLPGTIEAMVETLRLKRDAMITYPNYDKPTSAGVDEFAGSKRTEGTKKDGGMCGHCFMIRGEEALNGLPMFDEQFEWWFGDDQLAWDVEKLSGSQYRLVGWPCDHLNEATASNGDNDWTHSAKGRDTERWRRLHG